MAPRSIVLQKRPAGEAGAAGLSSKPISYPVILSPRSLGAKNLHLSFARTPQNEMQILRPQRAGAQDDEICQWFCDLPMVPHRQVAYGWCEARRRADLEVGTGTSLALRAFLSSTSPGFAAGHNIRHYLNNVFCTILRASWEMAACGKRRNSNQCSKGCRNARGTSAR